MTAPILYRIKWFDKTRGSSGVSALTFDLIEVNKLVDEMNDNFPHITHVPILADAETPEASL